MDAAEADRTRAARIAEILGDTRPRLPFVTNDAQRARWTALGYDIEDAVRRMDAAFAVIPYGDESTWASNIVFDWLAAERLRLIALGVPEDDPDLWRVRAAGRFIGVGGCY